MSDNTKIRAELDANLRHLARVHRQTDAAGILRRKRDSYIQLARLCATVAGRQMQVYLARHANRSLVRVKREERMPVPQLMKRQAGGL